MRIRFVVSACLAGIPCRYDGRANTCSAVVRLVASGCAVPACPEWLGGLPTPRPPCELHHERVCTCDGVDVTAAFMLGAQRATPTWPCGKAAQPPSSRVVRLPAVRGRFMTALSAACCGPARDCGRVYCWKKNCVFFLRRPCRRLGYRGSTSKTGTAIRRERWSPYPPTRKGNSCFHEFPLNLWSG